DRAIRPGLPLAHRRERDRDAAVARSSLDCGLLADRLRRTVAGLADGDARARGRDGGTGHGRLGPALAVHLPRPVAAPDRRRAAAGAGGV
ncbi:MAG: hypothetical protein AVDCRST_MAG15-676, partial [uncultured Rubellimicrobium sp.]